MNPMLWKMFFRTLFIQASYNEKKMQNLGFAFTLIPLARLWAGDERRIRDFLIRHLERFNTHPYLAAIIAGSVAKMELAAPHSSGEEVASLKKTLAPPFAAIGDSFFWGALKTFAATSAVLIYFCGSAWASLLFLGSYSLFHLYLRGEGFRQGYLLGRQSYAFLRSLELPRATLLLRRLSLVASAALAVAVISFSAANLQTEAPLPLKLGLLLLILVFYYLIKWGVSVLAIFYSSLLITTALAIL